MITVLFFAKVREDLGVDRLRVALADSATLGELKYRLIEQHGEGWAQVLGASNIVQAVNQEVASDEQVLVAGDEVAFFPPVTGG